MRRHVKVSPGTAIGLVALFVALGGTGYAVVTSGIPDAGGKFHGCVNARTGALRLVSASERCHRTGANREKAVSWAQTGPAGAAGAAGATGAAGAAGAAGPAGAQGAQGVQGVQGQPGTTGPAGSAILLKVRNNGGDITTTSSPAAVSLTANTWTPAAGEDSFVSGVVTVQSPAPDECESATDTPGILTVTVSIDGNALGTVARSADGATRTIPVGWTLGNGTGSLYPILGSGSPSLHTITATVSDDCGTSGGATTTRFKVTLVKVDVMGIS